MSDEEASREITPAPAATSSRLDEQTIAAVLDIEKQRIDRDNRRTVVIKKQLEVENAEGQRQFTFATQTRDAELALRQNDQKFVHKFIWASSVFGSVVALILLGLLVLGDDAQRTAAAAIVEPLLIGLAGFGVITALARAVNAITRR